MSEVSNVSMSASDRVIADASKQVDVTLSDGRVVTLKKPDVLAQFRLVEALGEVAKNEVYMSMCLPLIFVAAIDGDAVYQAKKKIEIEALITRLGENGIIVVGAAVVENFGQQDTEADKAAIKN